MIKQSKGRIFVADARVWIETDQHRSLGTLKGAPIGKLLMLNEETLTGNASVTYASEQDTDTIIVPVVGAINVICSDGTTELLEAGMAKMMRVPASASYEIANPYEESLVKYVQIWLKASNADFFNAETVDFDLENYQVNPLFFDPGPDDEYALSLVKLYGRQEELHLKKNNTNDLFVFVIQGALEVQYRLLHEGDGLALWDIDELEFEALSNDAILLIIEAGLNPFSQVAG